MRPYELRVSAPARRSLARIPVSYAAAVIELMRGALLQTPRKVGKPLRDELHGFHCARRGPYRIVYLIDDDASVIHVVRIEHRADVYRPR